MENYLYQIWLAECNASKAIHMANLLLAGARDLRGQLGLKADQFSIKQIQQFKTKQSLDELFYK